MARIVQKISVEVSKPNFFQAIVAKQFDNDSRFLQATFINGSEKINILPNSTVTINARRNDGEAKSFAGSVNSDGTVTVPLTYWMLELNGTLECDISVIDTDESKLTSTKFIVEVERASCGGQDIVDDESYDVLITALAEVAQAKANATEAANKATAAASNANKAVTAANTAASSANTAATNATKAANDANSAVTVLNPIKEEAIRAVDAASAAAVEANNAADLARQAANNAATATGVLPVSMTIDGNYNVSVIEKTCAEVSAAAENGAYVFGILRFIGDAGEGTMIMPLLAINGDDVVFGGKSDIEIAIHFRTDNSAYVVVNGESPTAQ